MAENTFWGKRSLRKKTRDGEGSDCEESDVRFAGMCERADRVDNRLNAAVRPYAPAFEVTVGDVIHFAGASSGRALEGLILCDQQLQSLCNKENLRSAPGDILYGRGARWKNSQRG